MARHNSLIKLSEKIYLLPGSPNTVIVVDDIAERVVVVDPGIGSSRGVEVQEAAGKLGYNSGAIILTHGHTDHLAAGKDLVKAGWGPVYAPRHCIPLIEDTVVRRTIVFGGLVTEKTSSMPMVSLKVDYYYVDRNPLPGGLLAIELPGHSPGHSGVIYHEDRVAVVGDAILGEKVLERFGIPFGIDLRAMLEAMREKLLPLAEEGYKIVPGHGPITEGERAARMIEANIDAIIKAKEVLYELLKNKPITAEEAAILLTEKLGKAELTPRQILLNKTAIASLLAWLEEDGKAEPEVDRGKGVVWRARRV